MPATWFESLGIAATVAAAGLAAAGIWQSKRAAARNADMIVRERRLDFELEVLTELVHHVIARDTTHSTRLTDAQVRLSLLDPEDVPLNRAYFTLPSTDAGHARFRELREQHQALNLAELDTAIKPQLHAELKAAIRQRLDARDR